MEPFKKSLMILLITSTTAGAQPPPGFFPADMPQKYVGTLQMQVCLLGIWPLCVWVEPQAWGQVCADGLFSRSTWIQQNKSSSFMWPKRWWCDDERKGDYK